MAGEADRREEPEGETVDSSSELTREERIEAYRELAEDPERREAIRSATRAAVAAGLL